MDIENARYEPQRCEMEGFPYGNWLQVSQHGSNGKPIPKQKTPIARNDSNLMSTPKDGTEFNPISSKKITRSKECAQDMESIANSKEVDMGTTTTENHGNVEM